MLKDIENFPEKYFGGVLPEQQDDKAVLAKFVVQLQTKIAELEDEIDSLQGQEGFKPRTIETKLCVDIKPRNRNKELKK